MGSDLWWVKIRFGIVGTSNIANIFLRAASRVKDFELVAVYSRNLEKAREFGTLYGASIFDDLEQMAKSKDIDAVYIASKCVTFKSKPLLV